MLNKSNRPVIGYLLSRFPKITETFILREILMLQKHNFQVEILPLVLEKDSIRHKEAEDLVARIKPLHLISYDTITGIFHWFFRRPYTIISLFVLIVVHNLYSVKFLSRSLICLIKSIVYAKNVKALECTHLHAHFATYGALEAYIIHKLTDISYSITAHAHDLYVDKPMLKSKLESAKFIATISEFNRDYIVKLYGHHLFNRINIIRCGIDPTIFQPLPTPANSICNLLTIASLEEYKGHTYLLQACAILKSENIPFFLTCVGGGKLFDQLVNEAHSLNIGDSVKFVGRQPQDIVHSYLSNTDVLVLPSIISKTGKMEGLPVVLMEALAMEIPVIATNISGISELVQNNITGYLVPEKDPKAIARTVRTILEKPELAKTYAKNGREKVLTEYDLNKNTERLITLFNNCMTHSAIDKSIHSTIKDKND